MMRRAMGLALALMAAAGCSTLDSRNSIARRGLYLDMHPELPATLRQAIESGGLVAGMSREMVVASVGWPEERETIPAPGGRFERWVYGRDRHDGAMTQLYFSGTCLVTIEQDASGQSAVALAGTGAGRVDGSRGGREGWSLGAK